MTCTRCNSADVHRARRKGLRDEIQFWLGRWPYRCTQCGLRFWAEKRRLKRSEKQEQAGKGRYADKGGPEMAFRRHAQKPQAKIVVQAESHEQLNYILFVLNQAVHTYQQASKKQEQTASSYR